MNPTRTCSLQRRLRIAPADIRAWYELAACHYRSGNPATFDKVFALLPLAVSPLREQGVPDVSPLRERGVPDVSPLRERGVPDVSPLRERGVPDVSPLRERGVPDVSPLRKLLSNQPAGVIVYSRPVLNVALRNYATNNRYVGLGDRQAAANLINREIRCISRVVIHPAWRGVGLAAWLVKETLPLAGTPLVEALATMTPMNNFFTQAGMTAYQAPPSPARVLLLAAFEVAGLSEHLLADPAALLTAMGQTKPYQQRLLATELQRFHATFDPHAKHQTLADWVQTACQHACSQPTYFLWRRPWTTT